MSLSRQPELPLTIATLLGITHNAVLTNPKQLRRKLGLGEGESLGGVIAGDEDGKEA